MLFIEIRDLVFPYFASDYLLGEVLDYFTCWRDPSVGKTVDLLD